VIAGLDSVRTAYDELLAHTDALDETAAWRPTGCAGWTTRDVVFHLLADAQRALVALCTPAEGTADVDAVSYWRAWQPGTPGARTSQRSVRIMASVWTSTSALTALHGETAQAWCRRRALVRETLDGLLGHSAPPDWDDARYALIGTGRAPLTDAERAALGADAARLPLFG
jgi:hypothetical protein